MRLGSALIPLLKNGWYYGQDINPGTISFGEEVLREAGISEQAHYTLFASDQFDFTLVDRPVQIAFANSVFSQFTLNSIFSTAAAADCAGPDWCALCHVLRAEAESPVAQTSSSQQGGREFETYPHQDPYHYRFP